MTVVPVAPDAGTAVLRALRANEVVCLLSDRDIQGGGIEVEFFGERTTLPGGPATLSLRTGAPVVPTAVYFAAGRDGTTPSSARPCPPSATARCATTCSASRSSWRPSSRRSSGPRPSSGTSSSPTGPPTPATGSDVERSPPPACRASGVVLDLDTGSVNRTRAIADVDREADRVVVTWDGGGRSTFHHLWLRDNCPCPSCRHPSVPERLVDTLSIADDVAPEAVGVSAMGGLDVTWAGDGHRSTFAADWLDEHAYDDGPRLTRRSARCGRRERSRRRPRSPTRP